MPLSRLIIFDGNSVIHRAYHALPVLTTKEKEPVNAIYGFFLVFFRAIKELQPDFVVMVFDFPAPNFRHKKYKEYKINRPPLPDDLSKQIFKIKDLLKKLNLVVIEKKGFEADDIIGTVNEIVCQKKDLKSIEVVIISGDKDVLQLIGPNTKAYVLKKGVKDIVLYDQAEFKNKYNFLPEQLLDFKALMGDQSDNIPGVLGVGEKTATDLILKFGKMENMYKEIESNSLAGQKLKSRLKEILLNNKDKALLSMELVKIKKDVPIDFDIIKCSWNNFNKEKAKKFLIELEFNSLIKRLDGLKDLPAKEPSKENLKLW